MRARVQLLVLTALSGTTGCSQQSGSEPTAPAIVAVASSEATTPIQI